MPKKKMEKTKTLFEDEDTSDISLDAHFMQAAIALAKQAYPAPNPQVGAVLVKNSKIIGQGFHAFPGGPHAELAALQDAEKKGILADGATMYVTLEPCSHFGKTPPCVDALVVAGIKRVVIGCIDQNEIINGAGAASLTQAGVAVTLGVCAKECAALYKHFFHAMKMQRPFVTLKAAVTLDGKIAPLSQEKNFQERQGERTRITGEESHRAAHELRRDNDAVLVGIGTVLADNPQLNCRIPCRKQPVPIIVDSRLRIPLDAVVLKNPKVIIATTQKYDKKKYLLLKQRGVRFVVTKGKGKDVAIEELLKQLPSFGILSVLVEGGAEINASFLEKSFIDSVCFFIAPKIFGSGVPVFASVEENIQNLSLTHVTYKQVGNDICVEADVAGTVK